MTDNRVCFNPDLLKGYDDQAVDYQMAVDALTDGHIPDRFDPCVDADQVPASFTINRFDSQNPASVHEYVTYKTYYQTRAVLATWWVQGWAHDNEPWPPEMAPIVSREDWEQNPIDAICRVADLPDHAVSAATFAGLLASVPQTDQTLAEMEVYLGQQTSPAHPGVEFPLIQAYRLATDRDLRFKIAVDLLDRFKNQQDLFQDPAGAQDASVALWREWTTELVQILVALHMEPMDNSLKRRISETLADIGGDVALDHLTKLAIAGVVDPLDALLQNALVRPEIAPRLARILAVPSHDVGSFVKEKILRTIGEGRVAPAPQLAAAVAKELADTRGWAHRVGNDGLFRYIAQSGPQSVPLLIPFVTRADLNKDEFLAGLALESLAGMDDPRAKAEMKKIIRGDYPNLPKRDHDEPIPRQAMEALVRTSNHAAHQTALELVDELKAKPEDLRWMLYYLGTFYESGGSADETGYQFFKKIASISADPAFSSLSFDTADDMTKLANRCTNTFARRMGDFTPAQQVFLIQAWAVYYPWSTNQFFYDTLHDDPQLSPEARKKLDDVIVEKAAKAALTSAVGASTFFFRDPLYPESLKARVIDRMISLDLSFDALRGLANETTLSLATRRAALMAIAQMNHPEVENVLVRDNILNNNASLPMRRAAVDALKARAKLSPFHDSARAALQRCLPIPATVASHIQAALKGL